MTTIHLFLRPEILVSPLRQPSPLFPHIPPTTEASHLHLLSVSDSFTSVHLHHHLSPSRCHQFSPGLWQPSPNRTPYSSSALFSRFPHGSQGHRLKNAIPGTSLVVQWLRLRVSNAGGVCLIPGWGTKIPHAAWHSQKQTNNSSHLLKTKICQKKDRL